MKISNLDEHELVVYSLPDGTELEVSCVALEGEDVALRASSAEFNSALDTYVAIHKLRWPET